MNSHSYSDPINCQTNIVRGEEAVRLKATVKLWVEEIVDLDALFDEIRALRLKSGRIAESITQQNGGRGQGTTRFRGPKIKIKK